MRSRVRIRRVPTIGGDDLDPRRVRTASRMEPEAFHLLGALRAGLSFKVTGGNVLALTPPLIITREEMDQALDILERCLSIIHGVSTP